MCTVPRDSGNRFRTEFQSLGVATGTLRGTKRAFAESAGTFALASPAAAVLTTATAAALPARTSRLERIFEFIDARVVFATIRGETLRVPRPFPVRSLDRREVPLLSAADALGHFPGSAAVGAWRGAEAARATASWAEVLARAGCTDAGLKKD